MDENVDEVVRRWRKTFDEKTHWTMRMKLKVLTAEAEFHRSKGREEMAKAVEAFAREISN